MNTDLVKSTKSRKRKFSSNISDPVADLLTRIRNANLAYKDELIAPISKLAESILKILQQEGYIDGFDREGEGVEQAFRIRLKYGKGRERTISGDECIDLDGEQRPDRMARRANIPLALRKHEHPLAMQFDVGVVWDV